MLNFSIYTLVVSLAGFVAGMFYSDYEWLSFVDDLPQIIEVDPGAWSTPIDGDTLRLKLRLADVDTPEIKGTCHDEVVASRRALDYSRDFIRNEGSVIQFLGTGYYGRPLVRIQNHQGVDLGRSLIEAGLAVPYNPGRQLNPWCP